MALGFYSGKDSYLQSTWNVLDGVLVSVSLIDILEFLASTGGNKIFGILRVLRLLRTLRPLRSGSLLKGCVTARVWGYIGFSVLIIENVLPFFYIYIYICPAIPYYPGIYLNDNTLWLSPNHKHHSENLHCAV